MMKGSETKSYEEWLKDLGRFSLRRLRMDIPVLVVLKYLKGCHTAEGWRFVPDSKTRINGMECQRYKLNIKKNYLTVRTID